MIYLLFVLGFIFLIKGADLLVEGASSIAKRFGISTLVIGLTVVAFGTSAPEWVVSLMASLNNYNDLAISNIIGSNISNVFLILGISALIAPLTVQKQTVLREIPFAIFANALLFVFVLDKILDHSNVNQLTRTEGIALLSVFCIFLYYSFAVAKNTTSQDSQPIKHIPIYQAFLFIALGLTGLFFGGKWIVDGAIHIASIFGLSQALIGLTVIAIGTSLPELAASGIATYKGKTDLAIGNIVGSNVFNILLILGSNATIKPIPYDSKLNVDMEVALISVFLLLFFVLLSKKKTLDRWEGGVFVALYMVYMCFLVIRG